MILLDTSGLLAAIDRSQRHHKACVDVLLGATGSLILSPFVLAELDYLLATRVGIDAELALRTLARRFGAAGYRGVEGVGSAFVGSAGAIRGVAG